MAVRENFLLKGGKQYRFVFQRNYIYMTYLLLNSKIY